MLLGTDLQLRRESKMCGRMRSLHDVDAETEEGKEAVRFDFVLVSATRDEDLDDDGAGNELLSR